MFRFKRARKLRTRANYHERKASTPAFIFSVCSERFAKLNFNHTYSNEMIDSVVCRKIDHVLPRRKGWGKPISAARIRKLRKNRAEIVTQESIRRGGVEYGKILVD